MTFGFPADRWYLAQKTVGIRKSDMVLRIFLQGRYGVVKFSQVDLGIAKFSQVDFCLVKFSQVTCGVAKFLQVDLGVAKCSVFPLFWNSPAFDHQKFKLSHYKIKLKQEISI